MLSLGIDNTNNANINSANNNTNDIIVINSSNSNYNGNTTNNNNSRRWTARVEMKNHWKFIGASSEENQEIIVNSL